MVDSSKYNKDPESQWISAKLVDDPWSPEARGGALVVQYYLFWSGYPCYKYNADRLVWSKLLFTGEVWQDGNQRRP